MNCKMSNENMLEFVYSWKVRNFSLSFHKNCEKLESSVFKVDGLGGSQWNLLMYPRGHTELTKDFISLFLRKKINDLHSEKSIVSFVLSIGTGDKILMSKKVNNHTFEKDANWGWYRFIKRSQVIDDLKSVPEDILNISCRLLFDNKEDRPPDYETCTAFGVEQSSFLWNIKITDAESQFISKEFSFSKDSLYEIALNISEDLVQVHIRQKEQIWSVSSKFIRFKLSLISSKGSKMLSMTDSHLFEMDSESDLWGFPSFITRSFLDNNKDTFLETDTFTLFCEFVSSNGTISDTPTNFNHDTASNVETNYVLVEELRNMFSKRIHSDIELKVGMEVEHAHKSVLAARSPVFSAMFDQDMIESKTGVVCISDVDANTLKLFLEFIYTGSVATLDYEKAKKLLVVAEKYQVLSLKEYCASYLECILSLKNVCEILEMADMNGHERLKQTAMQLLATNSSKFLNSLEWLDLSERNTKLGREMFSYIADNFKIVPKNFAT